MDLYKNREQINLSIYFGKNATHLALYYLEQDKYLFIGGKNKQLSSALSVNRNTEQVSVFNQEDSNNSSEFLHFSSIYEVFSGAEEYLLKNMVWSKTDLLAACLEEIKDYVLSNINSVEIAGTVIVLDVPQLMPYKQIFKDADSQAGLNIVEIVDYPIAYFKNYVGKLFPGKYLLLAEEPGNTRIYDCQWEKDVLISSYAELKKAEKIDRTWELREYLHNLILKGTGRKFSYESVSKSGKESLEKNIEYLRENYHKRPSFELNVQNYGNIIGYRQVVLTEEIEKILSPQPEGIYEQLERSLQQSREKYQGIYISKMFGSEEGLAIEKRKLPVDIYGMDSSQPHISKGALDLLFDPGHFVLDDEFRLLLSDDTDHVFVERYTDLENLDSLVYLSLIEDSVHAQLIISHDTGEEILQVPAHGFLRETIILEAYAEEEGSIILRAGSNQLSAKNTVVRKIGNLRVGYRYPEAEGYE